MDLSNIHPSLRIDSAKISEEIIRFIAETFNKNNFTNAVVGVSGGIDSAVSLSLAVKALGAQHVFPYMLPYGDLNTQGVVDGTLVIEACGIPSENVSTVDIKPFADAFFLYDPSMDHMRKGNIMARCRMIVLFDASKKHKALVVGTENKSEHYLGYYTRFGDEASDIEPIRSLYKTQVYQLAEYLEVPEPLLTKAPTAGLWDGQTDEGEFGFTYKEADEILLSINEGKSIDLSEDSEIMVRIKQKVDSVLYKHCLPYKL